MIEVFSAALLFVVVAVLVLLGILAGMGAWRLNRANRVAPDVETVAPLSWLWSPTRPARMHRRLRTAVVAVHEPTRRPGRRDSTPPPTRTTELCRELAEAAVHLDHHLVLVARQPRPQRRRMLVPLEHQLADVERLSLRLARMKASLGPAPGAGPRGFEAPKALADIELTMDLLDEAREELEHIERAEGLVDPVRVMAGPAGPTISPPRGVPAGEPRAPHAGPPPRPVREEPRSLPAATPAAATVAPAARVAVPRHDR